MIEGIKNSDVLADKGYDDDKFIKTIEIQGCRAAIPLRKNRKDPRDYDKDLYKERHLTLSNASLEKSNILGGYFLGT
ncbi:transposase, partial [bacterium]|nr:transposase [bacterium]